MSVFTPNEIEYLASQSLGRLATVNPEGEPHVVPARFRYNPEMDTIDVGGWGMGRSKKFRDAAKTGRAAFVVDDIPQPRQVRGVEIRGKAEAVMEGGEEIAQGFDTEFIRITPTYIASWGIDSDNFQPIGRAVDR
jgi:pyridoxamine 5'-phosphate oxidase family protein